MTRGSVARATELVNAFYEALNSNDMPTLLGLLHPQIVRNEFEGSNGGGTFRGLAEVQTHFEQARKSWAEGACTPEKILANDDRIVVLVHVRVRVKDRADWNEGRVADTFKIQDGKIIEFHSFFDQDEALKWAGLNKAD